MDYAYNYSRTILCISIKETTFVKHNTTPF